MSHPLPSDLISYTQARKLLGISTATLTKLLREGVIRHFPDPLDRRVKLVSKSEVLALKVPRAEAA